MNFFLQRVASWFSHKPLPPHLQAGQLGERSAKRHLKQQGLKFLTANFRTERGEIDLVMRDKECLVFVEVKTRSGEEWNRPAAAVNARKQRLLSKAALEYLRRIRNPKVRVRFDIVEVLLENEKVVEIRHLPNAFPLTGPCRYG